MIILEDEEKKKSKEISIENNSKNKILRRGQTDIINVASTPLAALKYLVVGLQRRKGMDLKSEIETQKWHLQEVIIKDLESETR